MKLVLRSLLAVVCAVSARGAEPPAGTYWGEVFRDHPAVYYRFEGGEALAGEAGPLAAAEKVSREGVSAAGVRIVADGALGSAASFDGASLLEIPAGAVGGSGDLSVELWFRSTQAFARPYWPGSAALVSQVTSGFASGDWCLLGGSRKGGGNDGQILVGVGPKGGEDEVLASRAGLNDGAFHHVVWARRADGQNWLYVDGALQSSRRDGGGDIRSDRPIQVGGETGESGGAFFKGEMDELAIYASVLGEERVKAHYATGKVDPRLAQASTGKVDFARDIKPLFREACFKCHGLTKEKGGFSLATQARAMEGGDEGLAILAGNGAASPLVQRLARLDEGAAMPPEGKGLSAAQVGLVRAWIDQGAVWSRRDDEVDPGVAAEPTHWSFKVLQRPPVPERAGAEPVAAIDAFVLEKLDEVKLSPAPAASKAALLRRASFDLIGLPPTREEIAAFVGDSSAEAFAKVIDRLLASSAHGERWARHWLDVVRYADSGGYETDIFYEQAWRYRDYVIRSFNEDKPYDRFLMEQVAGDELWPEEAAMQDAVAVWTLGEWPNALDAYPDKLEYVRRTDQVSTLSEAVLGLTMGCANCHQHKYDPITQRDYFGMEAIFAASESYNKNTGAKAWGKGERSAFRVLRHAEPPREIHLLKRGELSQPTKRQGPALPAFLPGGGALPGGIDEAKQRRSQLARWLVSPQNPLPARVIANRMWQWHFGQALAATPNDLGTQGAAPSHPALLDWLAAELVESGWSLKKLHRRIMLSATYQQSAVRAAEAVARDPQNVWLAGFPRRRLEAEAVWDQLHMAAGTLDLKPFGAPFVPRLAPEELQGMYDLENKPELKWPVTPEQNRRAIYILNRRSFRFPFFEAFDPPHAATSCAVRQTTTVPAQALTLLNNRRVAEQAGAMARRITREVGSEVAAFAKRTWLLAYSREASEGELAWAEQFIAGAEAAHAPSGAGEPRAAALVEFCLGVINTTEFIYTN